MRRLLYIGHVWPEPRSSAAGERTLSLLRLFAASGWHVTFASAAEPSQRAEGLAELTVETARILLNDDSFDGFVAECRPDVVVFDRFMTEEQYGWRVERQCPAALRVLDTVDLHCLRRARQTGAATEQELRRRLLTSDDAKREIAAIWRSDLSLMISHAEYAILEQVFSVPPDLIHHLPFMIEAGSRTTPSFKERAHFATIGNFLHAPNGDSVRWLHQEIWPLIRSRLPQAELRVYGAYIPQSVAALDDAESGFRVSGWAPDARAALAEARVCLAPLRFGAGLKGKIVDAMIAGTPTVTTTIGAEAMGAEVNSDSRSSWCGTIADDAQSIADAAVELHERENVWLHAQKRGFDIVATDFNGERLGRALLQRVQGCLDAIVEIREENFTGAMLRHHRHRATEYMARWIQAKNANSER